MGLYLWLTLYLYRTAQASHYIFLSGFLPDGNVQWLLFFFAEWGPNSGEHEAPESPWVHQQPASELPPTFLPAWPVLSAHGELHALAMPWLLSLCPGLCPQPVSTQKISLPLQGKPHRIPLWETSHVPAPLAPTVPLLHVSRDPGLHLYYNTSHNVTCSPSVYS